MSISTMSSAPQPSRPAPSPKPSVWDELRRARQSREPRVELEALLIVQQQIRYSEAARHFREYGLVYEGSAVVGVANLKTDKRYRLDGVGVCDCEDLLRQKLNEALKDAGSPLRLACKHIAIRAALVQLFEQTGGGIDRATGRKWGETDAAIPDSAAPAVPKLGVGELIAVRLHSGRTVGVVVSGITDRGGIELAKEGSAEWFPQSALRWDGDRKVWGFDPALVMNPRRSAFFNHLERKARREGAAQ